jgi:hypothetical protein
VLLIVGAHGHRPDVFQLEGIDCIDVGQCRDHPIDPEYGRSLSVVHVTEDRLTALDTALDWGAVDALSPPWEGEDVLRVVHRALRNRARLETWVNRRSSESADSLRRRLGALETLQQIGQSVSSSLDLDEVLTKVVETAVGMTNAEEGSLLIVDEDNGELYMRAARNFQDDFVRTFRLPIDDTLAGEVVRTGRAVVLDDDTPQKIKTAYLVRALVYVPLKVHGRVIGVLGVDNRTSSQPFHEGHLTVMSALANEHGAINLGQGFPDDEGQLGFANGMLVPGAAVLVGRVARARVGLYLHGELWSATDPPPSVAVIRPRNAARGIGNTGRRKD